MSWGKAEAAQTGNAIQERDLEVDFWQFFEASASPWLVLRPDAPTFSVVRANDAYLEVMGYDRQRIVGRAVAEVSPMAGQGGALGAEVLTSSLARVLAGGLSESLTAKPHQCPAGDRDAARSEERLFIGENTRLPSRPGALPLLGHRLTDVTSVVREATGHENTTQLEQLLEERTASLDAANRELEAFGYSVSHDLRAPLRAIDGFSEALSSDYQDTLDSQGRHYVERIRRGAQRMSSLIEELLGLSRIHRAPLRRLPVDLSELGREIMAALQARDPGRRVLVQIEEGMMARADSHLVRVAVLHLLSNAWKFTAKTIAAEISFSRGSAPQMHCFCVRDNGVGFDAAYARRLFSPFQRMHSSADFEGTGIGLATVQRIIMRHGGRVSVEAKVGQGASFTFSLGDGND